MSAILKKYIENENLSPSAWAEKVGIPQPVISRLLAGTRGVSLKTALRIQQVTGGKVRVEDLTDNSTEPVAQNA